METTEIKINELEEKQVAFVSFTGNYIGNAEVFKNLFEKLGGWAGPKGLITPDVRFLSAYQDDPKTTPPDQLTVEVCMPISDDTQVEGEIKKRMLPGGKYAVLHAELTGPEEYGPAWNKVVEWINKSNYEIDMSRPSYEIYQNNPNEHPQKHHLLDICMSVKLNE
ncbi:GyrI-like domain-containing protein [archaeon]|nr:GyrI-like domain-containing protein [archaeon]